MSSQVALPPSVCSVDIPDEYHFFYHKIYAYDVHHHCTCAKLVSQDNGKCASCGHEVRFHNNKK